MGLVIAVASVMPLLMLVAGRRFAMNVPKVLIITLVVTLSATAGLIGLLLGGADDPGMVVLLLVLGAPLVAVPIAAVTATSLSGATGYGLAAAIMAFGGWAFGVLVFVILVPSPEAHGLFTGLLLVFAIPGSYAATAAVYAAALGKRA